MASVSKKAEIAEKLRSYIRDLLLTEQGQRDFTDGKVSGPTGCDSFVISFQNEKNVIEYFSVKVTRKHW